MNKNEFIALAGDAGWTVTGHRWLRLARVTAALIRGDHIPADVVSRGVSRTDVLPSIARN